jgi:nitrogen fixation NifU-like protein
MDGSDPIIVDPYNETVRALFFAPQHAGSLSRDYGQMLFASVAESDKGSRLELAAGIAEEVIVEMRFKVWGCPHLIAAAEALCKEREHGAIAGLSVFEPAEIMARLAIPVEKTGRILLLEDALKSLWAQYSVAD